MKKLLLMALFAALAMPQCAQADLAIAFEFDTPGDDLGWQHNSSFGGSNNTNGPTAVTVAGTGEGVLTAQTAPTNGDPRVLHNPDLMLPAGFTAWETVEVRFRQLDELNGSPQALAGTLGNLHLGINGNSTISVDGNAFVEETPGDTEFWYTATLDISGNLANDIIQIRLDPIASTSLDYQLDYVRVNATPEASVVPEPSSIALLGLAGMGLIARRRK